MQEKTYSKNKNTSKSIITIITNIGYIWVNFVLGASEDNHSYILFIYLFYIFIFWVNKILPGG